MSYTIQFEERAGYLYARTEGQTSYENGLAVWCEIGDKCKALSCKKLLVEECLEGQITTSEMYMIVTKFPMLGLLGVRLAFYDRNLSDEEVNQFAELVGLNRGLMAKVFQSLEAAQAWLLADCRNPAP